MPISRYPRPGYPIAPKILARYLERPAPFGAGPFHSLDRTVWARFLPERCFALASALIEELAAHEYLLTVELSNTRIPLPCHPIIVDDLELEARTYNCLKSSSVTRLPDGLREWSLPDLLQVKGFGIKSLVDFLTAIEPFKLDPDFLVPRSAYPVLPSNLHKILNREETIPAYLRCCVFPELPPGVKLEQLRLGNRTYNVLQRAGFDKHPERLADVTVEQALNMRGFGIDCLVDLVQQLYEIIGQSTSLKSESDFVPKNIGELVEATSLLPAHVLRSRIPAPKHVKSLSKLELQNRTFSTLKRYGFNNVNNLVGLTVEQVLQIRGFGIGCLVDLVEGIYRVGIEADENSRVEINSERIIKTRVPRDIRSLVQEKGWRPFIDASLPELPKGVTLQELQLSLRVFNALHEAGFTNGGRKLSGITIRELLSVRQLGAGGVCDLIEASYCYLDMESPTPARQTFEQLVLDCIVPSRNRRNQTIATQYLGLGGHKCSTLEEVGCNFGITRERVRQVVSKNRERLHQLGSTPIFTQLVQVVRDQIPCPAGNLQKFLAVEGLIEHGTKLEGVLRVFDTGSLERPCELLGAEDDQIAIAREHVDAARKTLSIAISQCRKFGCTRIDTIHEQLPDEIAKGIAIGLVASIIKSLPGFQWLEQESGWFWIKRKRGSNRLKRRIQKVLCVAPKISVSELRAALRRDYRVYVVPPVRVLREFCLQIGGCQLSGESIASDEVMDPETILKGDELAIVKLLLKYGPLCNRRELQRLAQAQGVSTPSFWQCVNYRPTITRFAAGIYGLTGATGPPDLIESMRPSSLPRRVLLDHGWLDDGRIWIAYAVSPGMLETGVINIPGGKKTYLQGQYDLHSSNGKRLGLLNIRENLAWGLGPFFRQANVECDDVLLIRFATSAKQATVEVGDEGLVEELTGNS